MSIQPIVRFVLSAAVLTAALAGCTYPEGPIPGRGETSDIPWVTMGSNSLRLETRIGDARRTRDENGILYIAVPVRNVIEKQIYVEYRITFLDSAGNEINHIGPTTLSIPAGQIREAVGNASNNQAKDFHVELNYPRVN